MIFLNDFEKEKKLSFFRFFPLPRFKHDHHLNLSTISKSEIF